MPAATVSNQRHAPVCFFCSAQLAYMGREVVCSSCRSPVVPDHPLQVQLDNDWKARDAQDVASRQKAENGSAGWQPEFQQANVWQVASDAIKTLSRQNAEQSKQIADLTRRIAALEKRKEK
jgi:hypothetical protein